MCIRDSAEVDAFEHGSLADVALGEHGDARRDGDEFGLVSHLSAPPFCSLRQALDVYKRQVQFG